jgi:sulfotransferase family protein
LRRMDGVVFISGCGHSGTTLMANIFAAHPDVYIPLRETDIFRTRNRRRAEEGFADLHADAEASGKRFLVEKSPRHCRYLSLIRSIVPGARFVMPVRDGRDVAASYARRTGDPGLGIRQWIKSNAAIAEERDSEDVFVYRHEDLVDDPESTVKRICGFTGVPFDEAMLRYHEEERIWFGAKRLAVADNARREPSNAEHRNWQINQPIFDNRGRWRTELAEQDLALLLEGDGRSLMAQFGYLEG